MADEYSAQPAATSPEAQPTGTDAPGVKLVTLKFDDKFIKKMFDEIHEAQQRRNEYAKEWDILIKDYCPTVTAMGQPEDVSTNLHFRNVHTKLSQIFHQLPDIILEPRRPVLDPIAISPLTGQPLTAEDAITIKKEVLNFKLGEDGIDAVWLMDEILTDCLAWSGHGAVKVGYKAYQKTIMEPAMIPDPNFVSPMPPPGSVLGLQPPPVPPMVPLMQPNLETGEQEPVLQPRIVTIYEDWYARRISPKKVLFSGNLRSGRVDQDACWVGHEFFYTGPQIKAAFNFDPETMSLGSGSQQQDDLVADNPKEKKDTTQKYHGYELYIKASEYDPEQVHPLVVYQLVLLEGVNDKPLVYRMSPDQTLDNEGRLTPDSMIGFPIDICSLRDHPDSPFVYSDAAFVQNGVKQLKTFRSQGVKLRDVNIGRFIVDSQYFTKEEVDRIKAGRAGDAYFCEAGQLAAGIDKIIAQWPQLKSGPDDRYTAMSLKQDIDEALGVSASEAGVTDDASPRTATEVANAGSKANARLAKDRQRAVKFFLRWVRKYDTLLIRYATEEDYIQIEGKLGEKRLEMWNGKVIGSQCSYRIKPDSQLQMDAARDRQQLMAYAKDNIGNPFVNQIPIQRKLARLFGLDPSEVIIDPMMAQMAAASGMPLPTGSPAMAGPGGASASDRAGAPPDDRVHKATGGMPNAPQPGSSIPPSAPR